MILILSKTDDVWRDVIPAVESALANEECVVTENYEEAIQAATVNFSPVVVMDYDCSETNPFLLMRTFRTKADRIKFILIVDSLGQREMAEAGGADYTLFEGFSDEELVYAIKKLLSY